MDFSDTCQMSFDPKSRPTLDRIWYHCHLIPRLETLNSLKYARAWRNILRRKKQSFFSCLNHKHNMETRPKPNALAPHGHIPFPGLTDEVVWEAFWLGGITLLNGDVKSNAVSWKFPASTWEWSSWKNCRAGSTSLLRNTSNFPRAKCNNSPDIIITKGKKIIHADLLL